MNRMHKADPKRPAHMQDKRSVVPIELEDVDQWLFGTVAEAQKLIRLSPPEAFKHRPA